MSTWTIWLKTREHDGVVGAANDLEAEKELLDIWGQMAFGRVKYLQANSNSLHLGRADR